MQNAIRKSSIRRGLAPLEFVLTLPVLLFVLALMVDAESKSSWKIRGQITARDAAWRSRYNRTGANLPNPGNWRPPATMSVNGTPPNPALENPALQQPALRGPQFMTFGVLPTLDQTRGGWVGQSSKQWRPPLLPKLGTSVLNQQHPLVDGKWQYTQMGIPGNVYRRIGYIYVLPQTDPSLKAAYSMAVAALAQSPIRPALAVLDRDEEIRAFYGQYHDFHPRIAFCDYRPSNVYNSYVLPLIRRIQGGIPPSARNGLPGQMARFWLNMYRQRQNQLRQQGQAAAAAALQPLIDSLSNYLMHLP